MEILLFKSHDPDEIVSGEVGLLGLSCFFRGELRSGASSTCSCLPSLTDFEIESVIKKKYEGGLKGGK